VPDFSAELTNLHPFFMLLGEAAATFVSLLFIAVTWNPHILGSQTDPRFLNVAVNAFRDLLFIIVISLAILLPHSNPADLGATLLVPTGSFFAVFLVAISRNRGGLVQLSRLRRIQFYSVSGLVYVASLVAEVLLLLPPGNREGLVNLALSLLVNTSFLGLFSAIQIAWYVMITARKVQLSSPAEPNRASANKS